MKKVISSAFILLLLLVALWVVTSWFLGGTTEQKIKVFFENEQLSADSIMNFQLLKYDSSFMGAKINVRAQLNPKNALAQFIQNSFSGLVLLGQLLVNQSL